MTTPDVGTSDAADDAIRLAAMAGLHLDEWQRYVLRLMLATDGDRWASFETAMVIPRQNGKSAILEARMLAALFLFDEELTVYTAHEARTAKEVMRRFEALVMGYEPFARQVKNGKFAWSHGSEGVELKNGRRALFKTRTKGSGRGFSGDLVILDEAMKGLGDDEMGALMPTLSSIPDPQIVYAGSAGDAGSVTLGRVVRRGRGGSPRLTYVDWCVDEDDYDPADPKSWAEANPSYGHRLNPDVVRSEQLTMSPETFARERLGVGTYPPDEEAGRLIPPQVWVAALEPNLTRRDPVAFGVAVRADRSAASIGVSWCDGQLEVLDVIDDELSPARVVERVAQLQADWQPCAVVLDQGGPAGSLLAEFERARVDVTPIGMADYARACGALYDSLMVGRIKHRGHPALNVAAASVQRRNLGDAWAWKRTEAPIAALEAATLARWGALHKPDVDVLQTIY